MNFYEYEVVWYNEFKENTEHGGLSTSKGITAGESYAEAMEHIESYYGKNCIEQINFLSLAEDSLCYDFETPSFGQFNFGNITRKEA